MRFVSPAMAVAVLLGCGGDRGRGGDGPDGGVLTFDAAMLDRDAGVRDARGYDGARPVDAGAIDARVDPTEDRRLFVPDVPNTYSGTLMDPGFEVIAHTVREDSFGDLEFLVAIRNTFTLRICAIDLETVFYDASGFRIGRAWGPVEEHMHRGSSGSGRLITCVGPGQVAMQSSSLDLGGFAATDIARMTWDLGGINIVDAVPTSDIVARDVSTAPDAFGRMVFTGRVENRSSATVRFPQIAIYGVNAVGRPLFESGAIESTMIPPGGSWFFETSPGFRDAFASFVEYAEASDL